VSSLATQSRGDRQGISQPHRSADFPIPGLTALWAETLGYPEICIAILDAPVDRANPCLESTKIEQRWLGHHGHCSAHGTEVASVIFASHDSPVWGIAPKCSGVSVPIYDCDPERSPSTNQHQLARAIYEALAAGAHIINVSAGQLVPDAIAEAELADAVRACSSAGVLIVAAVGNDGCDCLHVPAALPCVLAVGATRWDGTPLPGSNWGAAYGKQGILAPGDDIPVAGRHGRPELRTGTSYATAIVSGVAALLLSRERKRGRSIRPLLIRRALLAAAQSVRQTGSESRRFLAGRLNITEAIHVLDTWSNTMTHEDLDLAAQCNPASDNGRDAHQAAVTPSSEPDAAPAQRSQLQEVPAPNTSRAEYTDTVQPSACAACRGERQLVYALGRLNYDFGSEAGLDAFKQVMRHLQHPDANDERIKWHNANPLDERHLALFLDTLDEAEAHAWITALNWTLEVGGMPLYAVRPEGPQAVAGYERILSYFFEQFPQKKKDDDKPEKQEKQKEQKPKKERHPVAERVSVPGIIAGQATLFSGLRVPVINPDVRGLFNWNLNELLKEVLKKTDEHDFDDDEDDDREDEATKEENKQLKRSLREFLNRLYFELQNAGRTSRERALNYAGTNLIEPKKIFRRELREKHSLDSIGAERSTMCRLGSDCWDITLSFFNPEHPLQTVRSIYRYTVDVSEVFPVIVGEIRSWKAR
jgi:cyanobactin maturation PatA/PatG family protease